MRKILCLLTFVVYVTADIGITGQNQYLPPNKGYNYERPNIPFGSAPAPQTVIPPRPLPSPGYLPPSGPSISTDHHHHEPGMPFDFAYSVSDYQSANQQSHKATSDGDITRGEYRVNLPDGRIQVVRYTADWKNGYNAMVTYEPSSSPSQGLYGAPSNNAPNQGYIY